MQPKVLYLAHFFKWPKCVSSAKCMKQCRRFLKSWMFIEEVCWKILTWAILLQITEVLLKPSMQFGPIHCLTLSPKKSKLRQTLQLLLSSQAPPPQIFYQGLHKTHGRRRLVFQFTKFLNNSLGSHRIGAKLGRWASTDYHRTLWLHRRSKESIASSARGKLQLSFHQLHPWRSCSSCPHVSEEKSRTLDLKSYCRTIAPRYQIWLLFYSLKK